MYLFHFFYLQMRYFMLVIFAVSVLNNSFANEYKVTMTGIKNPSFKVQSTATADVSSREILVSGYLAVYKDMPETIILELFSILPGEEPVEKQIVTLYPIEILADNSLIVAGTDTDQTTVRFQPVLYRGATDDFAVNLCFTQKGIFGNLRTGNSEYKIIPADLTSEGQDIHWVKGSQNHPDELPGCNTDCSTLSEDLKKAMAATSELPLKSAETLINVRVAVVTDYETYVGFVNDTTKTIAWILSAMADASELFEKEVNIKLEVSYIKLWTSPEDPFTLKGYDLFGEFSQYTKDKFQGIRRDIALLLIKDPGRLAGGMAALDAIGDSTKAIVISGEYSVAHELGHIMGSPHTHNCYWPAGPGGTLAPIDKCATVEGDCGITEVIPQEGTIMSYCSPRLPVFGPFVRNLIRARTALKIGKIKPPEHTLYGKVTFNGKGLPNVKINIRASDDDSHFTFTNDSGSYSIVLPDNMYTLRAELAGFLLFPTGMNSPEAFAYVSEVDVYGVDFEAQELVVDVYEPDNEPVNAVKIDINAPSQKHSLHVLPDKDYVKFEAFAGQTYHIVCQSERGYSPFFVLFDKDGNIPLASSSNDPQILVWKAENDGTYLLKIEGSTGDYSISVSNVFSVVNSIIPGRFFPEADWGDYDNDGDPDLLLSGGNPYVYELALYKNENGQFILTEPGFENVPEFGLSYPVRWVDIDNDDDLDALVGVTNQLMVYYNDSGRFPSKKILAGNSTARSMDIGDFDDDGDTDILMLTDEREIKILLNRNGDFEAVPTGLQGVFYGKVKWVDFDNDGDLDIMEAGSTVGNSSLGPFSKIFRNDQGVYQDSGIKIEQVTGHPDFAFGDYDSDGDLDLAVSGSTATGMITHIYQNEAGTYKLYSSNLSGLRNASLAWGDYDNDGDLDLLAIGQSRVSASASSFTCIYENRNGVFEIAPFSPALEQIYGKAFWFDFNQDHSADIFIVGQKRNGYGQVILQNENDVKNNPPDPPTGLEAEYSGGFARLSWKAALDDTTPSKGLTYNVRLGNSPGGVEIIAPMSDTQTGAGRISGRGNAAYLLSKQINNLKKGAYYWSVQAIDNSYAYSGWAPEESFVINNPPLARAGYDQPVCGGTTVALDGSTSFDPDGDTLYYAWTAPQNIVLSDSKSIKPVFEAPDFGKDTLLMFTLQVNDGMTISKFDTLLVTIKSKYHHFETRTICQGMKYLDWTLPGTYTRVLQSLYGCDSLVTTNLAVYSSYKPVVTVQGDTLLSEGNYKTYQWSDANGPLNGATGKEYIIPKSGKYHLTITDENGCTQVSDVLSMIHSGLPDLASGVLSCSIIPNPNNGRFLLHLESALSEEIMLRMISPIGQVIETRMLKNPSVIIEEQFNVSHLGQGMYFLQIQGETFQEVAKIVVR
jgi:hypothetical protein